MRHTRRPDSTTFPRKGDEVKAGSDENLGNPILPSSSPSEWPSQRPLVFSRLGNPWFPHRPRPSPIRLPSRASPLGRVKRPPAITGHD
jgi:hypothetical protein